MTVLDCVACSSSQANWDVAGIVLLVDEIALPLTKSTVMARCLRAVGQLIHYVKMNGNGRSAFFSGPAAFLGARKL